MTVKTEEVYMYSPALGMRLGRKIKFVGLSIEGRGVCYHWAK